MALDLAETPNQQAALHLQEAPKTFHTEMH
jgi:hypothetical protein